MKGLLLKDFYMTKKYCKAYLFMAIVFILVSFVSHENLFFVFYPCLLCGMIPVNLLAYDERSHWMQYSGTLPYTKGQIVSCKYIIGLIVQIAVLIATGVSQAVVMNINGLFQLNDFIMLMQMLLIMATVTSSISLPFMFKLGVEKGRIAYYVTIGAACAGGLVASDLFKTNSQTNIGLYSILPILSIIGIGIYALSWYLSIVFFNKRELN
ncbi:MAG: ABC-2 transporter permease [Acutalibacteraceae bacterium]